MTSLPKAQFRAVVTCGFGSDLYPLVEPESAISSDEDGEAGAAAHHPVHGRKHGQTKALLPVAGKKMIDWVLERVEEAGVFGEPSLLRAVRLQPKRRANLDAQTSSSSRRLRSRLPWDIT